MGGFGSGSRSCKTKPAHYGPIAALKLSTDESPGFPRVYGFDDGFVKILETAC